ncbi:hypothetical protein LTR37_004427 [Vermiconidia calcicola]|uniref:Uncharacterized protein n=1 Tax=Vermiconidia calcicola TaxID=1690605 RepID=A0ACC3NM19_9PEZI|nr:hypothetical protein LTR37_004427 [Vermiconidia calcicola]
MFSHTLLATTAALLALTHAQRAPTAIITIEASHGGAGQGLTNNTVFVPLTSTYTNESALSTISTLYLVDSINSPLSSITCTPFRNADGTGDAGLAFTSEEPSFLSTNTVQVGSIVCISTDILQAPPGAPPGFAPSSSHSRTRTRTRQHITRTRTAGTETTATSTLVQTTVVEGGAQSASPTSDAAATTTSASATTSSGAAQQSGNAASALSLPGELFGGLAIAGFGLAFVL